MEVVRLTEARYAEQAEYHFPKYLSETLAANQMAGGRYNAAGEFGALYTASDAETAWEEFAHRLRRQGINSVPPSTTLLVLVLTEGLYADLTSPARCELWQTPFESLLAEDPTPEQQTHCHSLGRAVRAVADFLKVPSARAAGINVPLFPDRSESELGLELQAVRRVDPPRHLVQVTTEPW